MKKAIYLISALLAVAACNKQTFRSAGPDAASSYEEPVIESLVVTLSAGEVGSKAISTLDGTVKGNTVSTATVYVFGSDGNCLAHDAAVKSGDDYQAAFILKKASGLTVAAVVNKEMEGITTLESLHNTATTLDDNTAEGFVMYGEASDIATGGDDAVSIDVKHLAAMVEIDKVTNGLKEEVFSSKALVLKGIYLINVPVAAPTFGAYVNYTPSEWANKCEFISDESYDALLADVGMEETIALGESYSTPHYFYGYSNKVTADHTGDTWNDAGAATRLVVEMEWNGTTTWYYPITLTSTFSGVVNNLFKANNKLVISELVIENPGSPHPNIPIEKEDATFQLNILDWNTVLLGNNGVVTL